MKNFVFIIKPDKSVEIHKLKKLNSVIDINKKSYVINGDSIFTYLKRKALFFKDVYRYVFLSEANINTISADGQKINNINYINYNSDPQNYMYQTLLHSKVIKEMLASDEQPIMLLMLMVGFGLLIGLIIGLAFGHVKL